MESLHSAIIVMKWALTCFRITFFTKRRFDLNTLLTILMKNLGYLLWKFPELFIGTRYGFIKLFRTILKIRDKRTQHDLEYVSTEISIITNRISNNGAFNELSILRLILILI